MLVPTVPTVLSMGSVFVFTLDPWRGETLFPVRGIHINITWLASHSTLVSTNDTYYFQNHTSYRW